MSKSNAPSGRTLVKLRTARGRSRSSQQWLQRQLNDPYVRKAREEGRRSRAAYKLSEILDKYDLLSSGGPVIDFGAAPGGWSEIIAERLRGSGRKVVAFDLLEFEPIPGVISFIGDIYDEGLPGLIREHLKGERACLLMSDMAPSATGQRQIDHLRCIALVEAAADFIDDFCKEGGSFLAKVWQGGSTNELLIRLKRDFSTVKHIKPQASRADSSELYVLAMDYRPSASR